MKYKFLRVSAQVILSAVLVWLAAAFLASCGRGGNSVGAGSKPALATHDSMTSRAGSEPAPTTVPLAGVLREIDAYPVPKGVSAETWTMLTNELKKQLVARSKDGKTLSIAPTGSNNAVDDLYTAPNPAWTQGTLTWTEKLWGDCSNDGQVDIADLQPIAAHYGETSAGPGSPAYLADADGDGQVSIADLQPIANDYAMHIEGYQVWRGHWNGTSVDWETSFRPNVDNPTNTSFSADRTTSPPVSARPAYTYTDDLSGFADKANVRYKVVAFGDGAAGAESNVRDMPPPSPSTFNVSGAVTLSGGGLAGVTLTLTPGGLSAISAVDGTYTITGVADGSYTLTPSLSGYTFSPPDRPVTVSGADVTGQYFTAAVIHTVSGTVLDNTSSGLPGVTLALTPGGLTATSDASGNYTITDVPDGSYTLTPSLTGYAFTPTSRSVTVSGVDVTGQGFTAAPVGLADTPWPKFRGDSRNTGLSTHVGAQSNALKWSHPTGGQVDSSPAVGADGTLYIGSYDNKVYALNPTDGSVKWSYVTGAQVYSSPAISADGTVYVASNDFKIYAFNASDGSVKWTQTTGDYVTSSPGIAADGTVYIGGHDGNVYALNPADGSVKWTHAIGGTVWSSPAVGSDGTVYIGSGDFSVYALNPADGSVKWTRATGSDVSSSPAIGVGGTVYVGSSDGNVYALNPTDGSVKWSHATGSYVTSSPAIGADGTVYVGSYDNSLYALSPSDGSVMWSYATGSWVESSPTIGADGTVYIGSADSKVYAFNPADGTVKWSYTASDQVNSSPAIAADGTVYIGSNDGKLYAFGP